MNSPGLLIFDMDGTLVDSMKQHAVAFGQILEEEFGIPKNLSEKVYLSTAGQPLHRQFENALSTYANTIASDLTPIIRKFWILVQESRPKLFPDVFDSIKKLWQAGYTLVVISGCTSLVVYAKLYKTGINRYFRLMLGTDYDVPNMTKGEDHFKIIRKELNLSGKQFQTNSFLIGDGEFDMSLAKQAGILAAGRITDDNGEKLKRAGATFLIHNLEELLLILQYKYPGKERYRAVYSLLEHDDEHHS
jgi:phosphoglycolate phosphatase